MNSLRDDELPREDDPIPRRAPNRYHRPIRKADRESFGDEDDEYGP